MEFETRGCFFGGGEGAVAGLGGVLTEHVSAYPAPDTEAAVGLVFAELAGFFEEEKHGQGGVEEEDGAHQVGKGVWPVLHPLHTVFASDGGSRSKEGGIASHWIGKKTACDC